MTSTVDILIRARELVAKPGGWTQGTFARTADGTPCHQLSDKAACFCTYGAIGREAGGDGAAFDAIDAACPDRTNGVTVWNDAADRTVEEVINLFDRAIAASRGES